MSATNYGLNEVDEFAEKRDQVLLEQSGWSRTRYSDDEGDDEEEVLAASDEDESSSESVGKDGSGMEEELEDETLNAWGASRHEYYGADELDDDEAAKEIEEEARRTQRQHLAELNIEDYVDEAVDEDWTKAAKQHDIEDFAKAAGNITSSGLATAIRDLSTMDEDARTEFLKVSFPEFFPLCNQFTQLTESLDKLKQDKTKSRCHNIKITALHCYLGTLAAYFSVLLSEIKTNDDFTSMKDHPIMEGILTSKEVWRQASELPDDFDTNEENLTDGELATEIKELDAKLLEDEDSDESEDQIGGSGSESIRINKEEEESESEVELEDFEEYVAVPRVTKKQKRLPNKASVDSNDFLESKINDIDEQDKKVRKKTLRFYTSKIDQEENRQKDRFKGDDDIPYKERLYERKQRLLEEARKRGLNDPNAIELDGKDYNSEEEAVASDIKSQTTGDYYEIIKQQKRLKKEIRREAHSNAVLAARAGKLEEAAELLGDDGKRAINYQIMKNKGLTPKRKKDNRNSRVKKRKKYDKAQKKLKSIRAVYSGGQTGPYEGEKTGIKKNLSRSVRFAS